VRRRRIIVAAASAAAALAASIAALSATHAGTTARATAVGQQITIPGTAIQWAPPPADAQPALTADEAWGAKFSPGESVPDGTTVQLGSLTDAVGEYCGVSCDMWTTVDGISYRAYNVLAYGYYWRSCANDSQAELDCQHWEFIDADTGAYIMGVGPRMQAIPPHESASDSSSPQPTDSASPSQG
jgi:hypothetical protein